MRPGFGRAAGQRLLPFCLVAAVWTMYLVSVPVPNAAYSPHAAILIEGDGDFIPLNGVTGGQGTASDPFVIGGWEIDASSANGIEVRNTTSHFAIIDSYVHSGSPVYSAIVLQNASNWRVDNCTLESGLYGILADVAENLTVTANLISASGYHGISLAYARNASMEGNDITNSGVLNTIPDTYFWSGISVRSSSNVTIVGNSLTLNDHFGVDLYEVPGPIVTDNKFDGNWGGTLIDHTVDVFFSRNDVSNHPGYGFICTNTTRTLITENTFTNNLIAVLFAGALGDPLLENSNATIARNTGSGNHMTFLLSGIADSVVADNDLQANTYSGIFLELALRVDLLSNRMWGGDYGIFLYEANESLIEGNNVSSSVNGVMSLSSRDTVMLNNSVASCTSGISLETSTGWKIFHNMLLGNALQAADDAGAANSWDDGYPSGGNWWSDYGGVDQCSGPLQNVCPDPDGIGDTPYVIDGDSRDRYPLWTPSELPPHASFVIAPLVGNVSTPFGFDASSSWDPNEPTSSLEVRWDWEDDGTYDTGWSTLKTATRSYPSPGTYDVGLEVRDTTGKVNETARSLSVVNTAPAASFTAVPSIGGAATTFSVDASGSSDLEDAAGALEVRWDWEDDGAWDTAWTTAKTAGHAYPSVGTYVIRLQVRDSLGLANTTTRSVEVRPGPVTTIVVGIPNCTTTDAFVNSTTQFSFSVLDQSGTGIRHTLYRVDGAPALWVNFTSSGPFVLPLEGAHVIEWFSEDFLGNIEPVGSAIFMVDSTPPASSLIVGTPSYASSETFIRSVTPLSIQATETGPNQVGLAEIEYLIDGGPAWSPYSGQFVLAGEGPHTVEYRSTDLLGNTENAKSAFFVVDDTAPVTSLLIGEPKYVGAETYVRSATALSLQAVDGPSQPVGVNLTEYRVNGGAWQPYAGQFHPSGEWLHTLDFRSSDHLGNLGAAVSATLVVDDTPPHTSISPATGPFSLDTRFSLEATDNASGVLITEYRIDDGEWTTYAGPFDLSGGNHTIWYRSGDRLSNVEMEKEKKVVLSTDVREEEQASQNLKPMVAAAFSTLLALFGLVCARRGSRDGAWLRSWSLRSLPFVALEGATGTISALTGALAVPPLAGPGMVVDSCILVLGIVVAWLVGRRKGAGPAFAAGLETKGNSGH